MYFLILHTQNTAETVFVIVSKMQMQPTIVDLYRRKSYNRHSAKEFTRVECPHPLKFVKAKILRYFHEVQRIAMKV